LPVFDSTDNSYNLNVYQAAFLNKYLLEHGIRVEL